MNKKAFTLIELLVVIAIIGILSGLTVIGMNSAKDAASDGKKKANLDAIRKSLLMYNVQNGSYPIESGCTIGSCATLDAAIRQYLPNSPTDSYTYQSDGNDCTVQVMLSNGAVYRYSCLTNTAVTLQVVNGACGSDDGQTLSATPVNLCMSGTASALTGAWVWSCNGSNGGSNDSCSANATMGGHTSADCLSLNGTPLDDGSGNFMCRFEDDICPDGWSSYLNWTTTSPVTSGCTTDYHTWQNLARESCTVLGSCFVNGYGYATLCYMYGANCSNTGCGPAYCQCSTSAYANITQIGCR